MTQFGTYCCNIDSRCEWEKIAMTSALPKMSVRVLDKNGAPIATFFQGESGEPTPGFSDTLRDALLAFREQYPEAVFIDVAFA